MTNSIAYRPTLDGLRAIAILAVVLNHLRASVLPGGFAGVDVFFVLSGFLITGILLRQQTAGQLRLRDFYQRRIARILPALMLMLATTLAACYFTYQAVDLAVVGRHIIYTSLFLANFGLVLQLVSYFATVADSAPMLHTWSLAVEEQFYLLFPLLLLVLMRYARRALMPLLALLAALSLLLCLALSVRYQFLNFPLTPPRAWELLTGCMIAVAAFDDADTLSARTLRRIVQHRVLAQALPAIGILLLAFTFARTTTLHYPGWATLLPVLGAACLVACSQTTLSPVNRALCTPPMLLLGRVSYSLYLWHWPIFCLVDYRFYAATGLFRMALKLTLTVVFTTFSYTVVEQPARRFLNRPAAQVRAYTLVLATIVVMVALGYTVRRTFYYDNTTRTLLNGGLQFEAANAPNGTILLLGDSEASMFGRTTRHLARTLHMRLVTGAASGHFSVPTLTGQPDPKWDANVRLAQREHPRFLLYICSWDTKLRYNSAGLARAIADLQPYADHILLVTQAPSLPFTATRAGIRDGAHPPFAQPAQLRAAHDAAEALVQAQARGNVTVIHIDSLFLLPNGTVPFTDERNRELYLDTTHLSEAGTQRVEPLLLAAMQRLAAGTPTTPAIK